MLWIILGRVCAETGGRAYLKVQSVAGRKGRGQADRDDPIYKVAD
jgi:hypothetical protein